MTATTHNPLDESYSGELLEGKLHEQFLWGGAGNGPRSHSIPRQSLTRRSERPGREWEAICHAGAAVLRRASACPYIIIPYTILGPRTATGARHALTASLQLGRGLPRRDHPIRCRPER